MIDPPHVSDRIRDAYELVAELFAVGVAAIDPERATSAAIHVRDGVLTAGDQSVGFTGRVLIVGMGKAAAGMALGAERALRERDIDGVVVVKEIGNARPRPDRVEVLEAGHPLPDVQSIAAGTRMLAHVATARPGDIVLALISGGGSALAESLRCPVTLDALRALTDLMLRAGATINQLNAVRRALSLIKAGGLLAASPVPVVPLILSDVIGNDLGTIASGAVIPGPGREILLADACRAVEELGLRGRLPDAVAVALAADPHGEVPAGRVETIPPVIIGDNALAVSTMAARAWAAGRAVAVPDEWQGRTGEASGLGRAFAQTCQMSGPNVDLILGGGEATVTVRGDGDGGRNTEFALAAALGLAEAGETGWVVASLASDGEDANTGAAGATVDGGSVARAMAAGTDAVDALARNDSLPWCRAAGGLVAPGSTGTNVNDLYIGVRVRT